MQWMLKLGLIRRSCAGVYHLLPMALRSLEKLVGLIDSEMKAIGAAKMAMPVLTPALLWKKTGELFNTHTRSCFQCHKSHM